MAEETGTNKPQEPPRAKVVLVGIEVEKDRYEVVKVLAKQLGLTFDEAGSLMKELPVELIPSIPEEAGEQFAEKLREGAAIVSGSKGQYPCLCHHFGLARFCQALRSLWKSDWKH